MTEPTPGGYTPPDPNAGGVPQGPPPRHAPQGPQPGYTPPPVGGAPQSPPPAYTPPPPPPGYAPPPAGAAPQGPPPGYAPQGPPPGYAPQGPPPGYAPPPGGYPPPPTAGYPGAPGQPPAGAGSNIKFDASQATTSDWIVIGAGAVLFIFSFFGWLSVSYSGVLGGLGGGGSVGAWNEYWWLGTVLGVAVAVIVALRVLLSQPLPQIKPIFLAAGAAAGFLITLIALIEIFAKGGSGGGVSVGPGFGIWVCLVVAAAQTYFVTLWAQKHPGWSLPKLPGPANM